MSSCLKYYGEKYSTGRRNRVYGVGIRDAEGYLGGALPIRELEQSPEGRLREQPCRFLGREPFQQSEWYSQRPEAGPAWDGVRPGGGKVLRTMKRPGYLEWSD